MELNKKDYFNLFILALVVIVFLTVLYFNGFLFGSNLDWANQHWSFIDYFRKLIYDTKSLNLNFAFNLGAGENIYYFIYHGLFSPISLISLLFPFFKGPYFLIGIMIFLSLASTYLFYIFLRKRFDTNISIVSTLLLLLCSPFLFHAHRHIMFVSYMPFLILGLFAIDRYFEKKKSLLLIMAIFFIILSNYFYAIGSILSLIMYGIYKYLEMNKDISFKEFIKAGLLFAFRIILAIALAAFVLIPTAYLLKTGRSDTSTNIDLINLFIPKVNYSYFLYSAYGLGLCSIFIYSLVHHFLSNKSNRKWFVIIFTSILLFPIFLYIINGAMYVDAKAIIPFIPFAIFTISLFLEELKDKKIDKKYMTILFIVMSVFVLSILFDNKSLLITFDFIVVFLSILITIKYHKINILYFIVITMSLLSFITINNKEKFVLKENIKDQLNKELTNLVKEVNLKEKNIYRFSNNYLNDKNLNYIYDSSYYTASGYASVFNKYYKDFYFNKIGNEIRYRNNAIISPTDNILYNTLMGNKYYLGKDPKIGYELIKKENKYNIYQNNNVYPIGFATSNLISNNYYQSLLDFDKYELLLRGIITKNSDQKIDVFLKETKIDYEVITNNIKINKLDNKYIIDSNNGEINLKLKQSYKDKIIFISFDMLYSQSCKNGDSIITINGTSNKLTCKTWKYHNLNYKFEYVISSNEVLDNLKIEFSKGHYEIANIKTSVLEYDKIKNVRNDLDDFIFDKDKTKGNKIVGSINVKNDGYFMFSIPYDEGFNIYVDGIKTPYELVNEAFIGFKITKGHHDIKLIYKAPLAKETIIISFITIFIVIWLVSYERNEEKKWKKSQL